MTTSTSVDGMDRRKWSTGKIMIVVPVTNEEEFTLETGSEPTLVSSTKIGVFW